MHARIDAALRIMTVIVALCLVWWGLGKLAATFEEVDYLENPERPLAIDTLHYTTTIGNELVELIWEAKLQNVLATVTMLAITALALLRNRLSPIKWLLFVVAFFLLASANFCFGHYIDIMESIRVIPSDGELLVYDFYDEHIQCLGLRQYEFFNMGFGASLLFGLYHVSRSKACTS